MNQESLFAESAGANARLEIIRFEAAYAAWRPAARAALHRELSPSDVWWQALPLERSDAGTAAPRPTAKRTVSDAPSGRRFSVPRAYHDLATSVAQHRAEDRWALLYRLLWRLTHGEPNLLEIAGDPEVTRARRYADAVHRDIHKMKAFVRFRRLDTEHGNRFVAWFEPEHHILASAGEFFRKRFNNVAWSIFTPIGGVHWDGGGTTAPRPCTDKPPADDPCADDPQIDAEAQSPATLTFTPSADRSAMAGEDPFEAAWRTYYASIFNPARIKVDAMRSEMPQKYWKNLPEAHLIPTLLQGAPARVAEMTQSIKDADVLRCGPTPVTPASQLTEAREQTGDRWLALRAAGTGCQACPLWQGATQCVHGAGNRRARLVLVGEQPGDKEDLVGQPFVGPAGEVLDWALQEAGLERETLYLTNAVKHFKYEQRGRTRMHKSPSQREAEACRPWLEAELELINPPFVLALGATAARSLLGRGVNLGRDRGQWFARGDRQIMLTLHPAAVLRGGSQQGLLADQLVTDLRLVRETVGFDASFT